jgi:very-short-patch-repair endonuclease
MPLDSSELAGVRLPKGGVLSHDTAAAVWGLPTPHNHQPSVHVTVPLTRSRWLDTTATVHRRDLRGDEQILVGEQCVTSVLRTVCDLAQTWPLAAAVAAADAALHDGLLTADELAAATLLARGRGARRLRQVGSLVDGRAESSLESHLRVLIVLAGFLRPTSQLVICDKDGVFIARVDLAWAQLRLVAEADGFDYHSDRASFRRDRERDSALQRNGWLVLHFSYERIHGDPDGVIAEILDAMHCRVTAGTGMAAADAPRTRTRRGRG